MKVTHADIILSGLKRHKSGTYEQISGYCGLTPLRVVRRLKEMEGKNLIKRTGRYFPTSNNDMAEIWAIVEDGEVTPKTQATLF